MKPVAALFVLLMIGAVAAACDSIDPTAQFFAITFRNDLVKRVTLKACGDDQCHNFTDSWNLQSGETAEDNISDRDVLTRWEVQDRAGATIGCLLLSFSAKYEHVIVRLTQTVPCPGRRPLPLADISHGKRLEGET
jgi:hypothetical protein